MISGSTPVLLDTNILIHLARGGLAAARLEERYALRSRRLTPWISVVVVGELLAFARRNRWGSAKIAAVEQLVANLVLVDINLRPVLEAYAALHAHLVHAGSTMASRTTSGLPPPQPRPARSC